MLSYTLHKNKLTEQPCARSSFFNRAAILPCVVLNLPVVYLFIYLIIIYLCIFPHIC